MLLYVYQDLRNMRFLQKTENVKFLNFHALSLLSAFLGFPTFLDTRNGPKKGPQKRKKTRKKICESRFFTGAIFGPFLRKKHVL